MGDIEVRRGDFIQFGFRGIRGSPYLWDRFAHSVQNSAILKI